MLPLAAKLCLAFLHSSFKFALTGLSVYTSARTPNAESPVFNLLSHWTVLCLISLCFYFFTWHFICFSKELHCQQNTSCLVMFPILHQAKARSQQVRVPGLNFSDALLKIHRDG